jgi:hypothetical protein
MSILRGIWFFRVKLSAEVGFSVTNHALLNETLRRLHQLGGMPAALSLSPWALLCR